MKKTPEGFSIKIDKELLKQMERDVTNVPFFFKAMGFINYVMDPVLKVLGAITLLVIIFNFQ